MISGVNINLINKKMKKLDILIEEIELYKGKLLDKKYIYQELLEIRQELTKPLIIHGVVGQGEQLPNSHCGYDRNKCVKQSACKYPNCDT